MLGFRAWGLGLVAYGSESRAWVVLFVAQDLGLGLSLRLDLGFRVSCLTGKSKDSMISH